MPGVNNIDFEIGFDRKRILRDAFKKTQDTIVEIISKKLMEMKMVHTTKEGVKMLIAEMEDSHLENTIKHYCRKIKDISDLLDNFDSKKLKKSSMALSGATSFVKQIDEDNLMEKLEALATKLSFYVLEATIRNMDVVGEIQGAFGREKKVGKSVLALEAGSDYIDGDEDVEF